MEINQLVILVEKKIKEAINLEDIFIEDKSFLHKNHSGNNKDMYHLKITIKSQKLKFLSLKDLFMIQNIFIIIV